MPTTYTTFHSLFNSRVLQLLLVVSFLGLLQGVDAQPRKNKYGAYRTSAPGPSTLIIESDPSAQLLEGFMLIQKANAGDPVAEQEVGLRYLFGRGFPTDTVKAAFWIKKAADKNFITARYNLAILTNNGWGVEWNPFSAYKLYLSAAKDGMAEAEFMAGLTYVDDLVVPRDWNASYKYLSQSAEQGYQPAKEVLAEFVKRGIHVGKSSTDSKSEKAAQTTSSKNQKGKPDTSWSPIFLDLQRDPPTATDDSTLLRDAYREANLSSMHPFDRNSHIRSRVEEDSAMVRISEAAELGNPESLTLIGRLYEKGIDVRQNLILAAEYYIRAVRFDSPRASQLLYKLVRESGFRKLLEEKSGREDPDIFFVWAGLTALQYDMTLNDQKALELLQKASLSHHVPSLVELGLCSYQGRWVKQDKNAALSIWNEAASYGSAEARVRIAAAKVTGDFASRDYDTYLPILNDAAQQGSLIAQLAIAYSLENGLGLQKNKGEAAKLYRLCAARGSQNAYFALRRMYDELRPKDPEFQMLE
jgi:TPR repeat protein